MAHKRAAEWICKYLKTRDKQYLEDYYASVEYLLSSKQYERILLYLPFAELKGAPESFKRVYMSAWWHLTNVQDAAENFHEGDTFEVDARPNGELTRVVKCAHLLPWLLQAEYVNEHEVISMFRNKNNKIFIQSLRDTFCYLVDRNLLSKDTILMLEADTYGIEYRKIVKPLYVSKKRESWLENKFSFTADLATPDAKLEGPFFDNLDSIDKSQLLKGIGPKEVRLVGGSRFKGYGTTESDLDVWTLSKVAVDDQFYPGNPSAAHIYFNTAWICGPDVKDPDAHINEILVQYSTSNRKQSLERLESDLCQYRLLHKGFSRFNNRTIFETTPYTDMDGDCPFYDDEYRRVATMLFAKYVFIPDISEDEVFSSVFSYEVPVPENEPSDLDNTDWDLGEFI